MFGPGALAGGSVGGQPGDANSAYPGGAQPGWPAPGAQPGGYPGVPGGYPGWQGAQPTRPPRQVVVASIISVIIGVMSLLGALVAMTSAGAEMAATLGQPDAAGMLPVLFLICGLVYIVPAIFLHKRARWARIVLMVVAALGVLGGILSLPASIIGIALHIGILVMMVQPPTKQWFGVRH
ncbi:hypothetical protein [Kribbella deserti]|uniref:DUF4064 domain-containing protein n=1 Tax=Kribbella deserti TaxID=1926257 RepID=A0ABV6QRG8_9ACTN